jgi:uncharacterized membrane protein
MDTREPYSPNLNIGHLFSRSWPLFKENLGLIVGAYIVFLLLTGFLSDPDFDGDRSSLLSIIGFVIAGPLTAGLYGIMLRVQRHEPAVFPDLFEGFREFGRAFGVYAISAFAIGIGLVLLVVPGIILAVGLWPGLYLVMDTDLGVMDTLREAWEMTKGYRLQLFGVGVVLFFFTLAGLIALGIGVFFTGAMATLVAAAVYEELALAEV